MSPATTTVSSVIMVRRELDQLIRVGARLEPWGVVKEISEKPVRSEFSKDRFFGIEIATDDGLRLFLFYPVADIIEIVVVPDDEFESKAIEFCEFAASESQRRSLTGTVDQVLGAAGLE